MCCHVRTSLLLQVFNKTIHFDSAQLGCMPYDRTLTAGTYAHTQYLLLNKQYICTCVPVNACTHTCTQTHTHTCAHPHTRMHTHTHTHTHTTNQTITVAQEQECTHTSLVHTASCLVCHYCSLTARIMASPAY